MKIVHISDIHIRNTKYHPEYRRVFDDLYRHLERIKPDLVVNTGDTGHTKSQISPEFVEMTSDMIANIASRAGQEHIILGNHDFNLMNLSRQDAITPIVDSLDLSNVFLHKQSGMVSPLPGVNFWIFSLADRERYPLPSDWFKHPNDINIGLFHGSISTCVTDSNWRMTHVEHDLGIFDGLDYALLGDIHKQQSFKDGKIAYAGSLIQQNFGEELDKGFLLWEIDGKDDFRVTPITLNGGRKFYTVRLTDDLEIPDVSIEPDSHVRISPPRPLTLVQQKEIEKGIKKLHHPHDVITLSVVNIGKQHTDVGRRSVEFGSLRQIGIQEKLIRDFFADEELEENVMSRILDLNRKYQIHLDQNDDSARDVSWKINRVVWSNLFNFGEGNVVDFSGLGGVTGLFAPNGSGKSNFIDVLMQTCFDSTTKGIGKNIHLINDNKEIATAIVDVTANDQDYVIERTIERVKYGQRKFDDTKEWGKTTVNFFMVGSDGVREPLVGTLRPETEKNIRQRLGTFEDCMLTSLSAQWNPLDIIICKETKRREILYRFLDLDIFEQKCFLAKDEFREHVDRLKRLEEEDASEELPRYRSRIMELKSAISNHESKSIELTAAQRLLESEIFLKSSGKVKIDESNNDFSAASSRDDILREISSLRDLTIRLSGSLVVEKNEHADASSVHFDKKGYDQILEKMSLMDRQIGHVQSALSLKDSRLAIDKKNIEILKDVPCGDLFPTCRFLVDAFESKKNIELTKLSVESSVADLHSLLQQKKDLAIVRSDLEQKLRDFERETISLAARDKISLQLENASLRLEILEEEKRKLDDSIAHLDAIQEDIKRNKLLDISISKLMKEKDSLGEKISQIRNEITDMSRELGLAQSAESRALDHIKLLQQTRDTVTAYERYMTAMGKDGIAYRILAEKLPLINEEVNKILSNAADFNVFIEDDPEEQSIRLYLQYGEYKSRLLELAGGAEKMLASIAIRAALISISNLPKTNMFIIDEGFGKLDAKNLESVQRMFDYLRSVFDHVIVVSHIEGMKDIVDNIVDIGSDEEGYAHIEVGT